MMQNPSAPHHLSMLCLISLCGHCGGEVGVTDGRERMTVAQPQPSTASAGEEGADAAGRRTPPADGLQPSKGSPPLDMPPGSVETLCEVVRLTTDPQTPQMMIVLDRSSSMLQGDVNRWDPSVSAVRRLTKELESRIDFGLTLFPDPKNQVLNETLIALDRCEASSDDIDACVQEALDLAGDALNDPACSPGPVSIPADAENGARIAKVLQTTTPLGGTPTSETLKGLLRTFATGVVDVDEVEVPKYILLVTDGQPTCPVGEGSFTTVADVQDSNEAIEALAAADVSTYVIGYDTSGAGNEALAEVLDGFAQRGATGDTRHRPVEDEISLLRELQRIAGEIVTCSLVLEKKPASPEFVLVTLDGEQLNLNAPDGWSLVDDTVVQLNGASCETFRTGAHAVEASVQCEIVAPQ